MAISTYSELQTAIGNWLHRSDLADRIPEFITLAEDMFRGDPNGDLPGIRALDMEKRVTASISTEFTDLPSDFLEIRSLQLNTSTKNSLEYFSQKQLVMSYPHSSTGEPQAYSIVGDELQVRPVPDTAYTAELRYVGTFTALSDANTTNWLLTNHPSIYLYGSLIAAGQYIRDPAQTAEYAKLYRAKAEALNKQAQKAKYGDTLTGRADMMTP